ncbi:MAG: nicotinate phosphoribosyltransferase [Clostridiales bacterium]|nr:nicotinate phosphoribosyltransferase [Clostridiales bacterium]
MRNLTLLTDLYQLTMMYGYYKQGVHEKRAVFDIFFRANRVITYSVAAGLEQAIEYINGLNFGEEEISYLRSLNLFDEGFLTLLQSFRFTGTMTAVKEGTVVFPQEPILTVSAPLWEAQLVETALLNIIDHQTLIASKAAKVCHAANGGKVMEFGLRRAQGPDAGIDGARAAVIGGCGSTSNVLTGKKYGVPVSGTHSHSWVMNFKDEYTAFRAYADTYPDACMLLVDTYDVLKSGIPNAIRVFNELKAAGHKPVGIRLDSGDLAYLSKKARKMLDDAGFPDTVICASGDLDEKLITSLKQQGACIDMWGVGTKLITSDDLPALGGVYKMSAVYEGGEMVPKIKISETEAKITNPGLKTTYRIYDKAGMAQADLICLSGEEIDTSKPLTVFHPVETWKKTTFTEYSVKPLHITVFDEGKQVYFSPSVMEIRAFAQKELATFWEEYKRLDQPHVYKVDLSEKLYNLKRELLMKHRGGNA